MSGQARDWLPLEAAARDAVRAQLEDVVQAWSADWFVGRRVDIGAYRLTRAPFTPLDPKEDLRDLGGVITVACSWRGSRRLAQWALNVEFDEPALTVEDRRLLATVEEKLFSDLAVRLDQALGPRLEVRTAKPRFGRGGGVVLDLADDFGARIFSVAIPLDALSSLGRSSLPPAARSPESLSSLTGALGASAVQLEVNLGRASLSLSDLQGLAPGDVLILDTPLGGGCALALAGSGDVVARAALEKAGERLALTLHA